MSSKQVMDERVIKISFDNKNFEKNVEASMSTIDKLKAKLKFGDAAKELDNVSKQASKVDLKPMETAVESVGNKFTVMEGIAIGALARIGQKAIDIGTNLAKSIMIDPITAGFDDYQAELGNVRTMMIATGKDIGFVEEQLKQLKWYSDETSYSMSDMTTALQSFTAQDIPLEKAVKEIQGIANMAGYAGVSAKQASGAFTGFAKALAKGSFDKTTWSWLQTAKMDIPMVRQAFIDAAIEAGSLKVGLDGIARTAKGTAVSVASFTDALAEDGARWLNTAAIENAIDKMGQYSNVLRPFQEEYSKITGETVLCYDAIEILADTTDLSSEKVRAYQNAMKKATGTTLSFEDAQKQLAEWTQTASETGFRAGQEYRSFTDAIEAAKTAVQGSWQTIFKSIFGNAEQAVELWTNVGEAMYDVFAADLANISSVFQKWSENGGFAQTLEIVNNLIRSIGQAVKPFKDALSDLLPELTTQAISDFADSLNKFIKAMTLSEDAVAGLKRILSPVVSVLKVAINILSTGFKVVTLITSAIGRLVNKFLELIGTAGKNGNFIEKMFGKERSYTLMNALATILGKLIGLFQLLKNAVSNVWAGMTKTNKVTNIFTTLGGVLLWIKDKILDGIVAAFDFLAKINFKGVINFFSKIGGYAASAFKAIAGFVSSIDFSKLIPKFDLSGLNFGEKVAEFGRILKEGLFGIDAYAADFKDTSDTSFEAAQKFEKTESLMTKVGRGLKAAGTVLLGFFKSLDVGKVIVLAAATLITIGLVKITKAVTGLVTTIGYNFKKVEEAAAGMFNAFKGVGNELASLIKGIKKGATWKTILALAGALAVLAGSLVLLSKTTEPKELWNAVGAIAALAAIFSGVTIALGALNKAGKIDLSGIAKAMLGLSAAIAVMGVSLKLIASVGDWKLIAVAAGFIIGIIGVFIGLAALQNDVTNAGKALIKFSASLIILGSGISALIIPMVALGLLIKNQEDVITKGFEGVMVITGAFGLLAGIASALPRFGNGLIKFAAAIGLMSASLMALVLAMKVYARLDWEKDILAGAGKIVALMGAFTVLGMLAGVVDNFGKGMLKFAASVGILAISLNVLVKTIKNISALIGGPGGDGAINAFVNDWLPKILLMFGLLGTLGGVLDKFGSNMMKFGVGVLAISVAMTALVGLMKLIGFLSEDEVNQGIVVIGAFILAFGALAVLMGLSNDLGKKAIAFTAAVVSVTLATIALTVLGALLGKFMNWKEYVPAIASIAAVMLAFGGAMALASKMNNLKSVAGIAVMALVVTLLIPLVNKLTSVPIEQAIAATAGLSVLMLSFGGALALAAKNDNLKSVAAIGVMALALLALYPVFTILQNMQWQQLAAASLGLSVVLLSIAGALKIVGGDAKVLLAAASMGIVAGALIILAGAVAIMNTVEWSALGKAGAALGALLVVMALFAIPAIGEFLLVGVAGLAAFGVAIGVVGTGIGVLGGGIGILANGMQLLGQFILTLPALGEAALVGAASFSQAIFSIGASVAAGLVVIGVGITTATTAFSLGVANMALSIAAGLDVISNGIMLASVKVGTAGGLLVSSFIISFVTSLLNPQVWKSISSCGEYVVQGFTEGIKNKFNDVKKSADGLGQTFVGSIKNFFGIASPSKLTNLLGKFVDSGFIEGIVSGYGDIAKSGEGIGSSLMDGLTSMIGGEKATKALSTSMTNPMTKATNENEGVAEKLGGILGADFTKGFGENLKIGDLVKDAAGSLGLGGMYWQLFGKKLRTSMKKPVTETKTATDSLTNSVSNLTEGLGGAGGASGAAGKAAKSMAQLTEEYGYGSEVILSMVKNQGYQIAAMTQSIDVTGESKKALEAFIEKEYLASDAAKTAGTNTVNSISQVEERMKGLKETFDRIYSSIYDKVSNVDFFAEIKEDEENYISGDELLENMKANYDRVLEWQGKIQELLARGIGTDLAQKLVSMGVEGMNYVDAFTEMSEEELADAVSTYGEILTLPNEVANNIMGSYAYAGLMATEGFTSGLSLDEAGKKAQEMGFATLQELMAALEVHSPSEATRRIGLNVTLGFINGLMEGRYNLMTVVNQISHGIIIAVEAEVSQAKFNAIGRNVSIGLANGIREYSNLAVNEARSMARRVREAAEEAFDENSPSKIFYGIGRYLDEGLALGIEENSGVAEIASGSLADSTIRSMRDALAYVGRIINGEIDLNPVIKPTIDLSDLQAGVRRIDSMMEGSRFARFSENQNGSSETQIPINVTTNTYLNGKLIAQEINEELGVRV